MNTHEDIEDTGFWWNPESPEEHCCGTLTVSKSGRISLELLNPPSSLMMKGEDLPIVHGQLKKKGQVSAIGITISGDSFSNRIQIRTYLIDGLLIGYHISKFDEAIFSEARIEIEGLYEWVGFPKIPLERDSENNAIRITPENIAPKHFSITNDLSLSISQDRYGEYTSGGSKLTLEFTASIGLKWNNPKNLPDIQNIVYRINSFLCLALDQPLSLKSIKIPKPNGDKNQESWIDFIYQSMPEKDKLSNSFYPTWFLFSYKTIEKDFGKILSNYLEESELKIAYDLYFSATAFKHILLETRFLLLIQGLEVFHRLTSDCKKFPKKEFKNFKKKLISCCEDREEKKLINDSLAFANECSLKMRMNQIMDGFPTLIEHRKQFIDELVDTRNYFTHFDPRKKEKAKFGRDLWFLSNQLEALFSLCILRNLGFSDEQIQSVIDSTSIGRKLDVPGRKINPESG
jgi:hypothetical protein